jgi:hypothetical protein
MRARVAQNEWRRGAASFFSIIGDAFSAPREVLARPSSRLLRLAPDGSHPSGEEQHQDDDEKDPTDA